MFEQKFLSFHSLIARWQLARLIYSWKARVCHLLEIICTVWTFELNYLACAIIAWVKVFKDILAYGLLILHLLVDFKYGDIASNVTTLRGLCCLCLILWNFCPGVFFDLRARHSRHRSCITLKCRWWLWIIFYHHHLLFHFCFAAFFSSMCFFFLFYLSFNHYDFRSRHTAFNLFHLFISKYLFPQLSKNLLWLLDFSVRFWLFVSPICLHIGICLGSC